jgi:GAF domain-containing protein
MRRIGYVLLQVFMYGCATAAWFIAIHASDPSRAHRDSQLIAGGLLVFLPLIIGGQKERDARRERDESRADASQYQSFYELAREAGAEYEARLALTSRVLALLSTLTGRIATTASTGQQELKGQLKRLVVDSAVQLCGPTGETRAIFYRLHNGVLIADAQAGRADLPRTAEFHSTDPRGAMCLQAVSGRQVIYVPDWENDPPPAWVPPPPGAPYRTTIVVPVFAGPESFGMLTIDNPEPYVLPPEAVDVAKALGYVLGAGLAIVAPVPPSANRHRKDAAQRDE